MRESIKRGDIDGASFRFVVGDESWADDIREIRSVKELHDLTIATLPASPATSIELRTRNNNAAQEEKDDVEEKKHREAARSRVPRGRRRDPHAARWVPAGRGAG